jgi:hypothetical protein
MPYHFLGQNDFEGSIKNRLKLRDQTPKGSKVSKKGSMNILMMGSINQFYVPFVSLSV